MPVSNPLAAATSMAMEAKTLVEKYTAGGVLVLGTIVRVNNINGKLEAAVQATDAHADSVLGLLLEAAVLDQLVSVLLEGKYTDATFTFTPGDALFLTGSGGLTQTVPTGTTGFALVVGFALTAIDIEIRIQEPIILD